MGLKEFCGSGFPAAIPCCWIDRGWKAAPTVMATQLLDGFEMLDHNAELAWQMPANSLVALMAGGGLVSGDPEVLSL
jgi:hypothetical protein